VFRRKSKKAKSNDAQAFTFEEVPLTKTKIRLRLMIAIPVMTTLLVLGLGLVIIDLNSRELLDAPPPPNVSMFMAQVSLAMEHTTIVIIVGGAIALIAGLITAVAITAPIRKLTQSTASIASGDLTREIHVSGEGELAMLGSAFNNMLSSINKYLLQTMSGGVVTIDEKGGITSMSTDAEVILGVSAKDFIGKDIAEMIPEREENREFHDTIRSTLRDRSTFVGREMVVTNENRDAIPISISTSFLRDRDNTLIGLIISFDDVALLRKVQEQMRVVDRLTTLGSLAAGIAHQVRNPLCSIRGLAQLLKESKGDDLLDDYSDVILSDVDRIDRVIERLLKFIQPTNSCWEYRSVGDIVEDSILLAKHEMRKKNITIEKEIKENLPEVLCQEENLMHGFLNLLVNAIQSIEDSGEVQVIVDYLKNKGETAKQGEIRIRITDDGPGISRENIGRIFNPSFTTKEDGAGFGLMITRQTIEAHGGRISVDSQPGIKTTFTVWLPIRNDVKDLQDGTDSRVRTA